VYISFYSYDYIMTIASIDIYSYDLIVNIMSAFLFPLMIT